MLIEVSLLPSVNLLAFTALDCNCRVLNSPAVLVHFEEHGRLPEPAGGGSTAHDGCVLISSVLGIVSNQLICEEE